VRNQDSQRPRLCSPPSRTHFGVLEYGFVLTDYGKSNPDTSTASTIAVDVGSPRGVPRYEPLAPTVSWGIPLPPVLHIQWQSFQQRMYLLQEMSNSMRGYTSRKTVGSQLLYLFICCWIFFFRRKTS
jgi:hypothetical protein